MQDELADRFPPGSDVFALIEYLQKQGFRPHWGLSQDGNEASYFNEAFFTCPERWTVNWAADAERRIRTTSAAYTDYCD